MKLKRTFFLIKAFILMKWREKFSLISQIVAPIIFLTITYLSLRSTQKDFLTLYKLAFPGLIFWMAFTRSFALNLSVTVHTRFTLLNVPYLLSGLTKADLLIGRYFYSNLSSYINLILYLFLGQVAFGIKLTVLENLYIIIFFISATIFFFLFSTSLSHFYTQRENILLTILISLLLILTSLAFIPTSLIGSQRAWLPWLLSFNPLGAFKLIGEFILNHQLAILAYLVMPLVVTSFYFLLSVFFVCKIVRVF